MNFSARTPRDFECRYFGMLLEAYSTCIFDGLFCFVVYRVREMAGESLHARIKKKVSSVVCI